MVNLIRIWKSKNQIFEGIKNNIFKRADVENIAEERLAKCLVCDEYGQGSDGCVILGTGPCCKLCGCSVKLKIRSLSSKCDIDKWDIEVSQEEEDAIKEELGIED